MNTPCQDIIVDGDDVRSPISSSSSGSSSEGDRSEHVIKVLAETKL